MSYKLEKPYNEKERADFIAEYNHCRGLKIQETDDAIFALEPWEELTDVGQVIDNIEAWENKKKQEEDFRIANLKLTKREVFLALYEDAGIKPEEIKSGITDPITLIEFEYANEYYRGNPLIDVIGASLGYSKEDLDYLFENKSFKKEGVKNA